MPNRIIRDGILDSRLTSILSDAAEVLYRRLMSVVDDFGRYESDPSLLQVKLFPRMMLRWPLEKISAAMDELTIAYGDEAPLVLLYSVGKKNYLQLSNFQQRERAKESKYKDPCQPNAVIRARVADIGVLESALATQTLPPAARATNSTSHSTSHSPSDPAKTVSTEMVAQTAVAPTNILPFPVACAATLAPELREPDPGFDVWAEAIYARHPKKTMKFEGLRTLHTRFAHDPPAKATFEKNHELFCLTDDWTKNNGRYAPKLHEFIENDAWMVAPDGYSPPNRKPTAFQDPDYDVNAEYERVLQEAIRQRRGRAS